MVVACTQRYARDNRRGKAEGNLAHGERRSGQLVSRLWPTARPTARAAIHLVSRAPFVEAI